MKTTLILPIATLIATATVHAQGSLTPPGGVPAPVMKSLDQIEARTPLVAGAAGVTLDGDGGFNITQPGSYYLTGNLDYTGATWAIEVMADNVALDLNGFTISGKTGNPQGAINIAARKNQRIKDGFIAGGTTEAAGVYTAAGFQTGLRGDTVTNAVVVADLTITGVHPTPGEGAIHLPNITSPVLLVERCHVDVSSAEGIYATSVKDCVAVHCKETSIRAAIVSGSRGESTGSGTGVLGGNVTASWGRSVSGIGLFGGQTVSDSSGFSTSGIGISAVVVENSIGFSTTSYGIYCNGNATNCAATSSTSVGLNAVNATNCTAITATGNYAMFINGTASFCRGTHSGGGTAMTATIAIGCTSGGGSISSSQKHLGTP